MDISTEIRKKIINILSIHSDKKDVYQYLHENDDLTLLGMNSITFIKMIIVLEREFDIEFEDDVLDFNMFYSLNILCEYVEKMMRRNNVIYSPSTIMDENTIKKILIQMVSKRTNSHLLNEPTFNDLTSLNLSLDDANKLNSEIRDYFSIILDRETIVKEKLYLLDKLSMYILNNKNED